ncbi:MAG: glycosyltransferase [Gammaproteobacteria bacterium]|nr:glycosyltransferase [Gammaproteobacteria bacterium]
MLIVDGAQSSLAPSLGSAFDSRSIEALTLASTVENDSGFDVVVVSEAIASSRDLKASFEAAINLLDEEGILLFELPLLSSTPCDSEDVQALPEAAFYPTASSVRYLVETGLGARLLAREVAWRGPSCKALLGLVSRSASRSMQLEAMFERVVDASFRDGPGLPGTSDLATLEVPMSLMSSLGKFWTRDLEELKSGRRHAARVEAQAHEATANAARATATAAAVAERSEQVANEMRALQAHAAALTHRIGAMEASTLWRATEPLRRMGQRWPTLAKRSRQFAKLVWWTVNGTLLDHIREFRRRREASARAEQSSNVDTRPTEQSATRADVELLSETGVVPGEVDLPTTGPWPIDRPLVSVVIPCFNYGHLVADAIRSVQEQTFEDIEIIVVEGGSSRPESREQLAEVARAATSPRFRVIWQDRPHRAGANRNAGISRARGKFICCLDADDRLAPTYIEKAVFMLEHLGYDAVSASLRFFGDRSEVWAPDPHPTLDKLLEANQVLTSAVFRRTFWTRSGGYRDSDPKTGHVHEDWLFWVRMAALGARFINLREPLLLYRSHGQTLSNSESVLAHDDQVSLVRHFNQDVLTPEALANARAFAGPPARPPLSFNPSARRHEPQPSAGPTLLLAMPYLILGGAERLLSAVVRHLAKAGWRVVIVTTVPIDGSHGDTTSWFESASQEIFHLPRFLDAEHWKDFVDYLFSNRRIDLAWVVGSAFFYEHLPRLRLRYPSLRAADLLFNTVGHTTNNRRYADCLDLIFVENTQVRDWLLAVGEPAERICLIESGVDLAESRPATRDEDVRELCGLPATGVIVGFFGRWSEEKDPLGFVEIARRVSPDLDVTFVMTGAGPLEGELRRAIDAAGFAPGRFNLKGAVPDVSPYLRACDILVLPSRLDGRPNVIMEALASGVAIVASRVGALPEMFEDTVQGYLCTPGDFDEFAKRIAELASDRTRLEDFKREARSWAERRLDILGMLDAYEQKLRGLIASERNAAAEYIKGLPR